MASGLDTTGSALLAGVGNVVKKSTPSPQTVLPLPIAGASYLTFQSWAFQYNAQGQHNNRQFNALCGDHHPQITDGYAKWNVVDRPLRQGITVPAGFNPSVMSVEIRFGIWNGVFGFSGWDTSDDAGGEVESNIEDLLWMAGAKGVAGPSPIVYVDSYRRDKGGITRTHLIPKPYWGLGWVINGGITWGDSYSNSHGYRIYQEASFTLLGYSPAQGGVAPQKQQSKSSGGFFKTNGQTRTALSIAAARSSHAPQPLIETLAFQIARDPRNNPCHGSRIYLERRSLTWQIPKGINVWVPAHSI